MNKDTIYDEMELSIAANNLLNYADFLSRSIESYIILINEVQENGIKDELICSKLSDLVSRVTPYKTAIYNEVEKINSEINKAIEDVSKADNFKFPDSILKDIISLLSEFL